MAKDPRKRQKKLERRKAKDKQRRKAIAAREPRGMAAQVERVAFAPILECFTNESLFDQGLAPVMVSRKLNDGTVAFVSFLVDALCLGVKDVAFNIVSQTEYMQEVRDTASGGQDIIDLEPAAARKLVEEAVEFAKDAGFPPHRDYRKAKLIFGDIDADECMEEFEFGRDGKPFFFAGPYDSQSRCREILNTLTNRFGPDGFGYVVPSAEGDALPAEEEYLELEDRR